MADSFIWAGGNQNDINGPNSVSEVQTLEWTNISISGKTNITFRGLFAANDASASWDNGVNTGGSDPPGPTGSNDFILIEYAIDAGAYTKLVLFIGDNVGTGPGSGKNLREDTNNDGTGDGPELTISLSEITKSIPGTGSTLKIRLSADVNGTNEEWAIDNFLLTSVGAASIPQRANRKAACWPTKNTGSESNRKMA
jgi:hypothetical protein